MAVMVAILCGVVWRRRKQHSHHLVTSAQLSLGRPSANCLALAPLQTLRRPNDPLPDVAADNVVLPPPDVMTSYGSIKRSNRIAAPAGNTPTLQRSGTSTFVSPKVQQQVWDLTTTTTTTTTTRVTSVISTLMRVRRSSHDATPPLFSVHCHTRP